MNSILWRHVSLSILLLTVFCISSQVRSTDSKASAVFPAADSPARAKLNEAYGKLPLGFEPNLGQAEPSVKFLARGGNFGFFFALDRVELQLQGASVQLKFLGADPNLTIEGEERLPGKSHYLVGRDRSAWRTNLPNYTRVKYEDVWPGIDVVFYGQGQQLEYDLVVAPGADPRVIRLAFEGGRKIRVDANGDLILGLKDREVRQRRPVIYQDVNGERRRIHGRFAVKGRQVGFEIARYDRRRELVIDPVLNYLAKTVAPEKIAVDSQGAAYITAQGEPQGAGNGEVLVMKLDAEGTQVIFKTLIGGRDGDYPRDIAIDAAGSAYVTGFTKSTDFPGSFLGATAGAGAGICYKSTDGASNWNYSGKGLPATVVERLVIDPNSPQTLYAGAGAGAGEIYKTADGGGTWKLIELRGKPLAVLPGNSNVIFAGASDGLQKSSDGGATWNSAGSSGEEIQTLLIDRSQAQNFYAATPRKIYRSVDGGANWAVTNQGLPEVFNIKQFAGNSSTLYVVGFTSNAEQRIYKTSNGGGDWANVTPPGLTSVFALAVDPLNPAVVYAGLNRGILKSNDGGQNWQSAGLADYVIRLITIDPANPATVYVSTETRVLSTPSGDQPDGIPVLFKSIDGGAKWDAFNNMLKGVFVQGLAIDPLNPATIYAGTEGNFEAFVFKLTPAGDDTVYSTLLGGSGNEGGQSLAVDQTGSVHLTGVFLSPSPNSVNQGFQTGSGNGFLAKLAPEGGVVKYFTLLPVAGVAVAADSGGKSYVAGVIGGVPPLIIKNGFQAASAGGDDAFVMKIDPEKSGEDSLLYSTYLGGAGADSARAIAVDAGGRIAVAGKTESSDFPVTPNALRSQPGGVFITKIDPAQSGAASMLWSTFLPTATVNGIALDQIGNLYVAGAASQGYPTTPGALQTDLADGTCPVIPSCGCEPVMGFCPARCQFARPACQDAFMSKISADGATLLYSTYLGTASLSLPESASDIALDAAGNVYLAGVSGLPATEGAYQSNEVGSGFIARLTLDSRSTTVTSVSAASFKGPQLSPESLAVGFLDAFGAGADNMKVLVRDSAGARRDASVLFSGFGQVNFQVPPQIAAGEARIEATSGGATIAIGSAEIVPVAPGIFSANAKGNGIAAAVVQRVREDGSQVYESLAQYDEALKQFVSIPIDLEPGSGRVFLALFGTGLRFRSAESAVKVTIGGIEAPVLYADKQPTLMGVDQINVELPRSLSGKGEVDLLVTVDGKPANTVTVNIK